MAMFLLVALLLYTVLAATASYSGRSKALNFTETGYIIFTPDMSLFVNKMSVCMWLRDRSSSPYPTVFNYGPVNQVRIDSDGGYIYMADRGGHFQSELARVVTKGDWYHMCLSWSTSSGSARYYVNGQHLGTLTSRGTLSTGNKMVIGHHSSYISPGFSNSNSFVGEISDLNVYAKELTAEEVKRMFSGGLCGLWEEENEDVRVLKWEDILKLPRTGSVSEVGLDQCGPTPQELLEECERRRNETSRQLSESLKVLENVRAELNTTLAEKEYLTEKLAETQAELNTTLAEKKSLTETLAEMQADLNTSLAENESLTETLAEKEIQMNATMENLQEALEEIKRLNRTWDWDMFSLDEYLNKTVSPDMAEQMKSSWDGISDMMIGFTITDQFIKFLRHIDTDEYSDLRPWSMLYTEKYLNKMFTGEMAETLSTMWDGISDKLVGITMTEKIIELLKYVQG